MIVLMKEFTPVNLYHGIASAKDSNPVYGVVTYYGRIQEICDLDYRIFIVPAFMCDWIDSRGIKKDDFGFTVVNFARLDHQSERFILMYKYEANGETDDMLKYHATFDFSQDSPLVELDDDILCTRPDGEVLLGTMESDQSLSHDEDSKQRGLTIKGKTTKGKVIVTYNKKGVLIGIEATKLASFEGMVARSMVPITYATWRDIEQEKKEDLWQYILEEMQNSETLGEVTCGTNDMLTQALDGEKQKIEKRFNQIKCTIEKLQKGMNHASEGASCQGWDKADFEDNPPKELLDTSCYLVIDISSNIVAKGTIMKHNDQSDEEFIYKVKDAVGFLVKWPRHLVIRCSDLEKVLAFMGKKRVNGDEVDMFARMVDIQLKNVESVKVQCEDDMFGYESFMYITWEDFELVINVDETTGSAINCYMMYLFKEIKNGPKRDHGICFVSPSAISPSGRKAKFKNSDESIRSVADRLSLRKDNDIVLVPYNPVAMKLYTAQSRSNKRVSLNWINVLCPSQPRGTECGYYVCKFMKEIVENRLEVLVNKNVGDGNEEYTDDDIHKEWVSYVANFIMLIDSELTSFKSVMKSFCAVEAVGNIRTVAAFCAEEKILELYARELVEPSKRSFNRGQIVGIFYGISQFFIFSSYGLGLWYGSVLMGEELASFKSVMKSFMALIITTLTMGETLALLPDLLKGKKMWKVRLS
ncbi:hypothetical protein F3Y22_tig00110450pilonHSYRG01184 [Hibiscus syriacus]|uniref:ABC transmembrane type-1 domain-containing protein n=1 Tax=Hibiscus syriacus TaxID=106335 RepID=A0A6A3AKU9_HIBSY|nr:hypothetical protein F3Y22_tig00110450pilonHSYRG01184 [Hibiscus syriacus]